MDYSIIRVVIVKIAILFLFVGFISCSSDKNNSSETELKEETAAKPDSTIIKIGIKMQPSGGVYTLPCYVNGVKMNFVFDTGASNVNISLTEAMFLYKNGLLEDSDIEGIGRSMVADGSIVENMIINLHSIEIGGIIITDVKAIVSESLSAPLLLGQSVIKRLGRFEMNGDSLFIFKKDLSSNKETDQNKEMSSQIEFEEVSDFNLWDKILTFFGNHDKEDKYLKNAMNAYSNGLYEKAEFFAKKAIDFNDDYLPSYLILGRIQYNQDKKQLAKQTYEKMLTLNPQADILFNGYNLSLTKAKLRLAECYIDEGRCKDGIAIAEEVLMKNQNEGQAYGVIFDGYFCLQDYEKAILWAKKLLDLKISDYWNSAAHYGLAYTYSQQGRVSEAIRQCEKALEIDSNDCTVLSLLAELQYPKNKIYSLQLRKKAAKLGDKKNEEWLKKRGYDW